MNEYYKRLALRLLVQHLYETEYENYDNPYTQLRCELDSYMDDINITKDKNERELMIFNIIYDNKINNTKK